MNNNIDLFIEVMTASIKKCKEDVDKYHWLYTNDAEFISMIQGKFDLMESIEKKLDGYYTIQGKYFGFAQSLLHNEDYEYVQMCLEIVDRVTVILSNSLHQDLKKKEAKQMMNEIEAGIEELKRQLANGELHE